MKPRKDFDAALRAWAGRPAPLNVDRVVAALRERPTKPPFAPKWRFAWAAAAMAILVLGAGAAWWWTTRAPTPVTVRQTASRLAAPSADSDVVVVWLDDQTPVHVFLTDASARGDQ